MHVVFRRDYGLALSYRQARRNGYCHDLELRNETQSRYRIKKEVFDFFKPETF